MYSKSDLARRGFLLPELKNADSAIIATSDVRLLIHLHQKGKHVLGNCSR